jgi:hypothetical protein
MAPEVRRAFIDLFLARTGAAVPDGKAWLAGLAANQRYLEDIWASATAFNTIIAWSIAGVGMLMLAFVFQTLSPRRPELDSGIYACAKSAPGRRSLRRLWRTRQPGNAARESAC